MVKAKPVAPAHDRKLHGAALWALRIGFALLALMALSLFACGIPWELSRLRGNILALELRQDDAGRITLFPRSGGLAEHARILKGESLVSINGKLLPQDATPESAWELMNAGENETITIEVMSIEGEVRSVTLLCPKAYVSAVERIHLSTYFVAGYLLGFHILFVLGFTLVAVLLFWRRSDDWLAAFLALALVMFVVRSVPEMYLVDDELPWLRLPVVIVGLLGVVLPVWFLYIFPSGRFFPSWTYWPALAGTFWYAAFFLPDAYNPIQLPRVIIFLAAMVIYSIGILAQIHRYRHLSTLVERQQTKWAVLGFAMALLISYMLLIPINALPVFELSGAGVLWSMLLNRPVYYIGLLLVPITLVVSMLQRGLWNVDVVINRTAVYTLLITLLGLIWNAGAALLDKIFGDFLETRSETLSIALSGVGAATLFLPIKTRLEKWINKRFYPDRVDFDAAMVELRPEVLEEIALPDLYHALVTTVPDLLQCKHAAIYDYESGTARLLESVNLTRSTTALKLEMSVIASLCRGKVLHRSSEHLFPVVVPLHVPRGRNCELKGALALGPRSGGRGFSRDHLAGLSALGARAGTAIHVLHLRDRRQSSTRSTRK